ncbi:T9SS outer membrane translocon Sov/SprA [Daejeonella oryzae]|uniref:T9SS outer membrane translocon Sov/SprA n=1 Tax=Daejeonella oryzae TaxID=1122943 RepID=UPI000429C6E2|nr:cell surface protein SprA [Daejeonella oryzae]
MKNVFTFLLLKVCFFIVLFGGIASAQNAPSKIDSTKLIYPFRDAKTIQLRPPSGIFLPNPSNIQRSVEFDPVTKQYIIREKIGDRFYRAPQYLSIEEYQRFENQLIKKNYWRELADLPLSEARAPGFIPSVKVNSRSFEKLFGGSTIDIRPQGSAELTFSGRLNRNENPLFNERQRSQGNFDFDQRIQMNVVGQIGEKLRITTNYNTEAQFDFENQVKLDYTGKDDEIVKKIEAGNVSLPLSSTLITGSQALFGLKTQLQFGRLNVTSVFSQQKSQQREITITNGSQQNDFRISADNYEANKHYFLAQYFRNNYNRALANIPIITSNINITKIEVWITNRTNSTVDSRDVLGLIDLGENLPYNTAQIQGGAAFSALPAGFSGPGFPQQSNNLLQNLPPGARLTNTNDANAYFQANGGTDNFAKLTYARKLTDREFTVNRQLGYISLNTSLNADEVLAVAYRYTNNGVEYQVGELSTDIAVNNATPQVLFVKLLKNETLKTNLPTWDLMMKNIYSLNAYQVSRTDFRMNIFRLDENSGIEKPQITEGANTSGQLWLQLTNLDNLNQQNDRKPDGYFDFIEGITIDALNGRITFPIIEPFGSDLAAKFNPVTEQNLIQKYVFQPLYDSTKVDAQQLFQKLNRYIIRGTYQSQAGSEFQLNAINIPQGSVQVISGTLPLQEGADFTVDYNIGRVRILNQALLNSGQPIRIKLENNELFGLQQRSLIGSRFDYRLSDKLNLGATIMNLTETPLTQKVNIGEESISNSIWGMDLNYSSNSRWLTRMVDKIPFINTREISSITFSSEYANFIPGHPSALNFAGSRNGASYLDDFESSRSLIDIKSSSPWQISGTPQLFPEAQLINDLSYGYNRARLAYYNIDPIFFTSANSATPDNIKGNKNELSNHYVREIFEREVFPFKQSVTGQPLILPTFDLAYYPSIRGPYNFTTTGLNPNGTLSNPRNRWGGIFRKLETNDFEALNIEFIEMWVLDPFIYNPNRQGGDLYFNLGNISEDILKDGRKSLENGLPVDGDVAKTDQTSWGRVPRLQPVIQAFDNNAGARQFQDVGIDGLSNNDERQQLNTFLTQAKAQLNAQASAALDADPSSDDYQYYRGNFYDQLNAGILKRYELYNGTEGNSKTTEQSLEQTGIENSAATPLPDGEDINRDNNSTQADEYYQYRVSIRPQDLQTVGSNYIADIVPTTVKLANGKQETVRWIQFKIPLAEFQQKVGNIQDFKSIRFVRMFMTDFADTTVMRFAKLQLVRGEWRRYNSENNPGKVITDPSLINPGLDNSTLEVGAVNIEENGKRTPIPYVVPPGIERERDISNFRGDTRQNEQSLAVTVKNVRDGYGRAAFRTTINDFRSYRRMEMFIHAEGDQLRDNDVNAFIRVGTDNQDNYYEYELPLKVTNPGSRDPFAIWPDQNKIDLEIRLFQEAKIARNKATLNGQPYPINVPFVYTVGSTKITVLGQPDLSKVRVYMLGIKNPLRTAANPGLDDGLDKTAQIWFNELRLTDFDERGGWAATARMNARLADFADITVSGSKSTIGFGSIDRRVSERNRADDVLFDVSTSMELGKFFPERTGLKVPMFVNFSSQIGTPQYDPRTPDLELKAALKSATKPVRDSIRFNTEDYTSRKSLNFTNVRKIRTNPQSRIHLWDIENWSATYAFNEYNHRDFINEKALQKTYRAGLAYNYSNQPKVITPFEKLIKSKNLGLIKDFNFSLLPSVLNFRIDVDRLYSENTLRNNDPNNFLPINTNFNKNFQMSRLYGISWNLTRSMQIDLNATNYSVIDEPAGRINGMVRDTIWENLKRLGRTTDYGHTLNITYNVPINKIPGLDWVTLAARYGSDFNWRGEPLLTLNDPNIDFGNTIRNSRILQLNPALSFTALYNKIGFIRTANAPDNKGFGKFLVNALTSIKTINGAYTKTEGIFLPGYLPQTDFLGQDVDANAPGYDFVFGSQRDIRGRALNNGWITRDSLQNQLYITNYKEDLNLRSIVEPFRDFRIELTAVRSRNFNYSTNFKFLPSSNSFENLSPVTTGDYSVSYFSLRTAFSEENKSNNSSNLFRQFENNRNIISQRLGAQNPNSSGSAAGFADGYGKNSQDVLIAAFLAAYTGKDANSVSLSRFPQVPIPNWRITYNGLTKYDFFSNLFASFDLNHAYRSTYNVNGFNSLVRYQESNGFVNVRDANGDFLPFYQFSQITLLEQFVPLLGIDMRLKNNITTNFEYRKSRILSFSLANNQLAQQKEDAVVFGFGYRTANFRFPFGLFRGLKLNNDMNFKLDFALGDRKTIIYRADVEDAEVSSGAQNITIRPSLDYVLNQRFNIRLFYDGNMTRPYTSQTFNTSFSNFGVSLRFTLQ